MAEPGTDGVLAGHLAAFARDAFERLASHSATARVLLHPGANAPLPPSIAAMAAPLASLLPATHDDEDAELGAELGVELSAEEDDTKDDAEGVETEEAFAHAVAASASARDDRVARAAKVELVGALHALWSLHGEASAASGDDFDADEVFLAASSQYDADDPEELPPAHHAVWRAEQSALIPLLAAANGATLSACDRRLGAMLVQMDAAAGGGALRAMGYLWGDAAAYLVRTDVALRQSTSDDRDRDPSVCVGTLAFARGDFSPRLSPRRARAARPRMRGGARRRRHGSRTRASRRRRRRARLSAPTPPPSRSRSCAGRVWRRSAARFAAARPRTRTTPPGCSRLRWRGCGAGAWRRATPRGGAWRAWRSRRRRPRTRPRARSPSRRSTRCARRATRRSGPRRPTSGSARSSPPFCRRPGTD